MIAVHGKKYVQLYQEILHDTISQCIRCR